MWTTVFICILIFFLMRCLLRLSMPRCMSNACLVGKNIIITGGNKGIGYQTALGLAARGCNLIIACRSDAEKEKNEIIKTTNNPNVIVKHLDLSSYKSVRQFAKEIHDSFDKIDVLINNAGIGGSYGLGKTVDGHDPLMQTNLFGPFLLTHLLLDLLKKAGNARVIFLSSILAFTNSLNSLEKLEGISDGYFWSNVFHYGNSKVALAIISSEFARRLKQYGITCNAVNPGYVLTGVFDNLKNGTMWHYFVCLFVVVATTMNVVEAAQISLTVAMANKYKTTTGKFLGVWGLLPSRVKDPKFCRDVFERLEQIVQLRPKEKI